MRPVTPTAIGIPGSRWRSGHRSRDGVHEANLKASVAGETHEYTDMYPGMAKTAREGFDEIADWFETLAKARKATPVGSKKRSTPSTPKDRAGAQPRQGAAHRLAAARAADFRSYAT